ncbi:alpha/beta hydrolase-fold protein [Halomonas sp. V046]|uniref:alpha/beta hydrolase-fold protein n=1 Tax=Halomonas sp. V046 TaxID=3459611 RepID=UPI004044B1FF
MTASPRTIIASLLAGLALSFTANVHAETPDPLPRLGLDGERLAAIGVSSGGYMAAQLAVAWPERFDALGLVATGPWGCAQGELGRALGQCMFTRLGAPDLSAIDQRWADYRERELVGSQADRGKLRVYAWQGGSDGTVDPAVSTAAVTQLDGWLADPEAQLKTVVDATAGHGWPVDAETAGESLADCHASGPPYLLACGTDLAGDAIAWWYPSPEPAVDDPAAAGSLLVFDQSAFDARGLADTGYLYLPSACEDGHCGIVVALHGCEMGVSDEEDAGVPAFVSGSGLNRWAAANRLAVLYPQAEATLANPKGCWDWWGFSESTWQLDPLQDSRDGRQVKALMGMIDSLQAAP